MCIITADNMGAAHVKTLHLLVLLLTVALLPRPSIAVGAEGARALLADSKAVASSTGGKATSASDTAGDADVTTMASASNGGTATASKSAVSGEHVVSTMANASTTVTYSSPTEVSWEGAPPCKSTPNSVSMDKSGRLWGWENNKSCAYKGPSNEGDSLWDSAPTCPEPVTSANSVADKSGRMWGWDNKLHVSCAFKAPSRNRKLLADSKAAAISTGGDATSTSASAGDADVTTVSSASNGGTATANKSADHGAHVVSSAANGNTTVTFTSSTEVSWEDAPPCKSAPNSVSKDKSGRLWGWENGKSCAYKAPTTDGDSMWASAPPCPAAATLANSVADDSGRLWGWDNHLKKSCAFKDPSPSSKKLLTLGWFAPSPNFIPNIFSWHGAQTPFTANQSAPGQTPENSEQDEGSLQSTPSPPSTPSPVPNPKPDHELESRDETEYDHDTRRTDVEGEAVNSNQQHKSQPDDTSGVAKAEVTDEHTASQAAAESPDGNAFAVSETGVDDQGNVQAHGHVEAKDKNGNIIRANVYTSLETTPANETEAPAPSTPTRRLKQTVTPVIPEPDRYTPTADPNASGSSPTVTDADPRVSDPTITTTKYGSGENEVECLMVNSATGQSLKCHKTNAVPATNTAASNGLIETPPVIPSPIPVLPTPPMPLVTNTEAPATTAQPASETLGSDNATPTGEASPSPMVANAAQDATVVQPAPFIPMPAAATPPAEASSSPFVEAPTTQDPSVEPSPEPTPATTAQPSPVTLGSDNATPTEASPSPVVISIPQDATVVQPAPIIPMPTSATPPAEASPSSIVEAPAMQDPSVERSPEPTVAPKSTPPVEQPSSTVPADDTTADAPAPESPAIGSSSTSFLNAIAGSPAAPAGASPEPAANTLDVTSTPVAEPVSLSPAPAAASPAVSTNTGVVEPLAPSGSLPADNAVPVSAPTKNLSENVSSSAEHVTPPISLPSDAAGAPNMEGPLPTAANTSNVEEPAVNAAVNNSSSTLFGATWDLAPACSFTPNKRNSVQDTLGRLWWTENGASCAYRKATGESLYYAGYVPVKWETAPACAGVPSFDNSMPDAEGRVWGWIEATLNNCKFVTADGIAVMKDTAL